MNILVCVKAVPETAEAELEISRSGDAVETDDLVFGINEWDAYAVEEAVRLKEARGGTITALSLGGDEAEDVLRRALAMGCDEAIRLEDDELAGSDPATVARALARAIEVRGLEPDLILTGVQSADTGYGQIGVLLAQRLDLPHATLAVGLELEPDAGRIVVQRELEAGTLERVELPLPGLVTVQSGINRPRYVSIMGIRKVRSKTIEQLGVDDLELGKVGPAAAVWSLRTLSLPPAGARAEMLEGSLAQVCARAAEIVREKGGRR